MGQMASNADCCKAEDYIPLVRDWLLKLNGWKASLVNLTLLLDEKKRNSLSAQHLTDMPGAPRYGNRHSPIEEVLLTVADLEERIKCIETTIKILENGLCALPAEEQTILSMRFVNHMTWWQVAYGLRTYERNCHRIKDKALEHLVIAIFGEIL